MSYINFNKQLEGIKVAKNVNVALHIIHFLLLLFFLAMHAYILVVVNVFSVTIYISLFSIIKKGKFFEYIRIVYMEIWLHMMLATILMGWDCGFQLYCFALVPIIFYSYYTSNERSNNKIQPIFISIISAIVFLFVRYYTYYNSAIYKPSNELVIKVIYFINVIIVFNALIIFMLNYTRSVLYIENSLRDKADYDELTKLYNRHKMRAILSAACLESKENMDHFYITIIDIDDFKSINDIYGHNSGDFVLKKIAEVLLKYKKDNMEICRWGGEEFLVLQNCKNNLSECFENIDLIRNEISNRKFIFNKKGIKVTITAGIAKFGHNMTVDEVINMADEYLYKGKNTGKNRVITF